MKKLFCDQCGAKLTNEICVKCNPPKFKIKRRQAFSNEEKFEIFDKIYKMCLDHFNNVVNNEGCRCECDCHHYVFEEAMTSCFGDDVFDYLNKLR